MPDIRLAERMRMGEPVGKILRGRLRWSDDVEEDRVKRMEKKSRE